MCPELTISSSTAPQIAWRIQVKVSSPDSCKTARKATMKLVRVVNSIRLAARAGLAPTIDRVDGEVVWRRLAR